MTAYWECCIVDDHLWFLFFLMSYDRCLGRVVRSYHRINWIFCGRTPRRIVETKLEHRWRYFRHRSDTRSVRGLFFLLLLDQAHLFFFLFFSERGRRVFGRQNIRPLRRRSRRYLGESWNGDGSGESRRRQPERHRAQVLRS